jgi:hypothetical protein
LNRRLDGPLSQFECFAEEKNTFSRLGFKPQITQSIAWSLQTIIMFLNLALNNAYTYSQ